MLVIAFAVLNKVYMILTKQAAVQASSQHTTHILYTICKMANDIGLHIKFKGAKLY